MKKLLLLLGLSATLFSIQSCHSSDRPDGLWEDNIKLSQKNVTVNSSENVVSVTSQPGWWLGGIMYNGNQLDTKSVNRLAPNFTFQHDDFTVERINGTNIKVTVKENKSGADRKIIVQIQSGDYYDGLIVNQSK